MNSKRTLRQVSVALVLLVAFLFQGTWALAGTTGGLRGVVTDEKGAPVAGAAVKATSASQEATATTDATGRFTFLSMAPDTYTVSIEKTGYDPISYAGVSVFADNVESLAFTMRPALKTIAKVTSRSSGDVVKSGVGQDVYSVNATAIAKSSAYGGGGNLDNAYSAISGQPGVQVPIGGIGWGQNVYIRGSQGFFTGFEYDGIPVNRAFDNYNSSTESNLGLQELQVYTGGGPASNSSSGTSGFINQVIRTGTYPGFGNLEGGIATSAFYHKLKVEAGGATPDRRFSYYIGLSGTNQANRIIDNQNGASYMGPGGIYASNYNTGANFTGNGVNQAYGGVEAFCTPTQFGNALASTSFVTPPDPGPPATPGFSGYGTSGFDGPVGAAPGCLMPYSGTFASYAFITDRENIANFHFAIPRKNGLRDDLQLLWSASSLYSSLYSSANDLGTNLTGNTTASGTPTTYGQDLFSVIQNGAVGAPGLAYLNATTFNLPFGTNVSGLSPSTYLQPSTTTASQGNGMIPNDYRDGIYNDTGIVKAQYTHALSDRAYVRLFGYTFFSDWTQAGAISAGTFETLFSGASPNYDLITHTAGGELQIADQINDKNLVQLTGNYTTANVTRFNNTGYLAGQSPVGLISLGANGQYTCYARKNTTYNGTAYAVGTPIPCSATSGSKYTTGATAFAGGASPAVPAACAPTCYWATLWNGNARGTFNTVKPDFSFASLTDEFRPNDKWLFDIGLRYEDYKYGLTDSNTAQNQFDAQIVSNYACYSPGFGALNAQLPPGSPPPAPVQYVTPTATNPTGDCNVFVYGSPTAPSGSPSYTHPNFTAASPSAYDQRFWSLRVSGTYTQSPDTVWRASAGRFTEPPISASVQYLYKGGQSSTLWSNFLNLGFTSPYHPVPVMSSAQADLSLERHIRGTDMSFKISPFYNFTKGFQSDAFIGSGFVTQVPVGNFRSYGAEFAFTKGDFNKDGLSGQFSLTYSNAKMQYQSQFGGSLPNQITGVNAAITGFNGLTKAGGGSPCYAAYDTATGTPGAGTNCGGATDIINPYYNMSPQGTLDPQGWYPAATYLFQPGVNTSAGYFDTPWVSNLILNWRKNKLAITPTFQFSMGTSYGSPYDVQGYDPRFCGSNNANIANWNNVIVPTNLNPGGPAGVVPAVASGAAQQCNYLTLTGVTNVATNPAGYLYIPNPQTGSFATLGAFREPSILTGNLQITYDVSPRVSVQATLANLFHTCFGGTKTAWTNAYPAGGAICGYGSNGNYISNYQNGAGQMTPANTSLYNAADNGGVTPANWQFQSYAPRTGSPAANGAAGSQLPLPFNAYFQVNIKL